MKSFDKNYVYIFIVYAAVTSYYLIIEYVITGNRIAVPLDDTWIHFRFAENFAAGKFFQYNISEPTPGTTSPLWVIILSLGFLLRIDPVFFSLLLGSIFFLLTCTAAYSLCLKLNFKPQAALFAALLILLSGRLAWSSLSGMEITLCCWLTLIALGLHLDELKNKKIKPLTGLILGLAVLARPEAMLLAGLYYIVSVLLLKSQIGENKTSLPLSIFIFLILVIPYPVFSFLHTGRFVPNTYGAQGAGLRLIPEIDFLRETGKLFFKDNFIILLLWFSAIILFLKRLIQRRAEKNYLLINLWIISLSFVSSVLEPNWRHHGRYLIPLIPFIIIAAIQTALDIAKSNLKSQISNPKSQILKVYSKGGPGGLNRILIRNAFVVLTLLLSLTGTVFYGRILGWNAGNINDQQINIGNWLKDNLPDEQTFAVNDIGAIAYVTKKKVVDLGGIVTPEISDFRKMDDYAWTKNVIELMKKNGVNYLIIYPEWFEYLVERHKDALEKVYSARLENNTICGGNEMFVYKIRWNKIS